EGTIYKLRNWFGHELGTKSVELEEENAKFGQLIAHYQLLHPLVEELVAKLDVALDNKGAWACVSELDICKLGGEEEPAYAKYCEAVQRELARRKEEREARFEEKKRARLARESGEEQMWVRVEGEEEVMWEDRLSWAVSSFYDADEGYEGSQDTSSEEDENESFCETGAIQADVPWEWPGEDEAYDSGWEEGLITRTRRAADDQAAASPASVAPIAS
ncbi:hypothetical protein EK21DRAFT_74836, partial [Setomelanomma holmii]